MSRERDTSGMSLNVGVTGPPARPEDYKLRVSIPGDYASPFVIPTNNGCVLLPSSVSPATPPRDRRSLAGLSSWRVRIGPQIGLKQLPGYTSGCIVGIGTPPIFGVHDFPVKLRPG